ncbi:hypothetical protein [Enterococcus phage Phi_Eg_SY1]|nr:hypothetical protein [Enterococcus phage Phi_Eg_SY1]
MMTKSELNEQLATNVDKLNTLADKVADFIIKNGVSTHTLMFNSRIIFLSNTLDAYIEDDTQVGEGFIHSVLASDIEYLKYYLDDVYPELFDTKRPTDELKEFDTIVGDVYNLFYYAIN